MTHATTDAHTARRADDPRTAPERQPRHAMFALARVETRRLLKHPALVIALAVYAAQWLYAAWGGDSAPYPVLHDESRFTQVTLLFVAAGVFLAVHLAVLRPARDSMTDLYAAVVLDTWRRAAAHLLSVLIVTLLSVFLVLARIAYAATRPTAVGDPSVAELLTGPAVVLLVGVLAVLLGCLSRSTAAGPITLAGLGVVTVAGALAATSSWRWLTLVAVEDDSIPPLPTNLLDRPAGLHTLYLIALAALTACAALFRSGLRGRMMPFAGVLALVVAVAAAAAQLRPMPETVATAREEARTAPAGSQTCATEGQITYCAFPEFTDRHRQWARVTEGILRWVPDQDRSGPYFVRQHVYAIDGGSGVIGPPPTSRWAADDRTAGTPGAVPVGTHWGTASTSDSMGTIGFAASFAHRVLDKTNQAQPMTRLCGSRALVVIWLAAQATPETAKALHEQLAATFGGTGIGFRPVDAAAGLYIERRSVDMALALLDRSDIKTGSKIKQNWDELIDTATPLDRASEILGVQAPAAGGEEQPAC